MLSIGRGSLPIACAPVNRRAMKHATTAIRAHTRCLCPLGKTLRMHFVKAAHKNHLGAGKSLLTNAFLFFFFLGVEIWREGYNVQIKFIYLSRSQTLPIFIILWDLQLQTIFTVKICRSAGRSHIQNLYIIIILVIDVSSH
uniref:Uncharacterized protein n=1 Tax=Meloidogyne incognita TaxID=6306 RepID=A0A914LCK1_MELIC